MHICDIQEIPSGDGLGSYKLFFLVINVFHRGLTDLPQEAIMLLEGVLTSISKETYNHLCVSRGGGGYSDPCNALVNFYFPQPFPSFQLTKTLGIVNADLITEYVVGYIIALERKYFTATQFQSRREWNM